MFDTKRISRVALFSAVVVLGTASQAWTQIDPAARLAEKEQLRGVQERDGARMMRATAATDRALILMNISQLEVRTMNYGPIGGSDGWAHTWYPRPDGSGVRNNFYWESHIMVGVASGPWNAIAQAHESYDQGTSKGDWEAMDGALGSQFASPPQTFGGYPLAAHSDLPLSWPAAGWPAPEGVAEVWLGTETWNKWQRIAEKEAFAFFDDSYAGRDGLGGGPVGLTVRKRVLAYGTQDAVFFQFEVENTGTHTLTGVYVGQTVDTGAPHTGSYLGFPRWDAARNALYHVGRNYSAAAGTHLDGGNNLVGWMAHVFLESPTGSMKRDDAGILVDNPTDVLTRLALLDWGDNVQNYEEGLYGAMSADLTYMAADPTLAEIVWKISQSPGGATPILKQDETHYQAYNPGYSGSADPFFYSAAGPITMAPGDKANYVIALVAAATEIDLKTAIDKATQSYQALFASSGPPPAPLVSAAGVMAGPSGVEYDPRIHAYPIHFSESGRVTLTWDGSASETALDAVTTVQDFQGYKLYRSNDRGRTWGQRVTDNQGRNIGWVPLGQWDLDDGITGDHPLNNFYLGDDSDLVRMFIDTDVVDGVEYWYSVTAYDFDPLEPVYESAIGVNPGIPNTVAVITGARTPGWVGGSIGGAASATLSPTATGGPYPTAGTVGVQVVDDSSVRGGTYTLSTVLGAEYGTETFPGYVGVSLVHNSAPGTPIWTGLLGDDAAGFGTGLLPVIDGLKINVNTLWNGVADTERLSTDYPAGLTTYLDDYAWWIFDSLLDPNVLADAVTKFFDVEVRFHETTTQNAYYYRRGGAYEYVDYAPFPGTVWDVSGATPRQVNVAVTSRAAVLADPPPLDFNLTQDFASAAARRYIHILNSSYSGAAPEARYTTGANSSWWDHDALYFGWWYLEAPATSIQDLYGTTAVISYQTPLGPGWSYQFTTTAPASDETEVTLDNVQVVPNPYFINAAWDLSGNRRKMQFRNVPAGSTVDIYTVAGELVASLSHESERGYQSAAIGTVEWNLWTYEYTEAAYGLYIYVVKAPNGDKKIGKFAIIR